MTYLLKLLGFTVWNMGGRFHVYGRKLEDGGWEQLMPSDGDTLLPGPTKPVNHYRFDEEHQEEGVLLGAWASLEECLFALKEDEGLPDLNREFLEAMDTAMRHLRWADSALDDWGGFEEAVEAAHAGDTSSSEVEYILEDLIAGAHDAQMAQAAASNWADDDAKEFAALATAKAKRFRQAIKGIYITQHIREMDHLADLLGTKLS